MYLLFHIHSMSFIQIFKAYSKVLCLNLLPLCVAFVSGGWGGAYLEFIEPVDNKVSARNYRHY